MAVLPTLPRRLWRPSLPWLWAIGLAVTVGGVAMRRSVGTLAWENHSTIAPSTYADNEAFYREMSLAVLALGVGLLLIATWRTFGPRTATSA